MKSICRWTLVWLTSLCFLRESPAAPILQDDVKHAQGSQGVQTDRERYRRLAEIRLHALQVRKASDLWEADQTRAARNLLNQTAETHRGFEFGYLNALFQGNQQELTGKNQRSVSARAVAVSKDGRWIVSAGNITDRQIRIWKIRTFKDQNNVDPGANGTSVVRAKLQSTLQGHSGFIECIAISNDGRKVVTGDIKAEVKVWDIETGVESHTLRGHDTAVRGVAFTPDDARIVSISKTGTTRIWDAEDGRELAEFKVGGGEIYSFAISPDGKWAATGSGTLTVFDLSNGTVRCRMKTGRTRIRAVAFSPDGKHVLSGQWHGPHRARLWDAETGEEKAAFPTSDRIESVCFRPDGKAIAAAGYSNKIYVCDTESGELIESIPGAGGIINGLTFTPDGSRVIAGFGASTRIYKLGAKSGPLTFNAASPGKFSRNGKWLAFASQDKGIEIRDTLTGRLVRRLDKQGSAIKAFAFRDDSRLLATADDANTIKLWDLNDGGELWSSPCQHKVTELVFSSNGQRLHASGGLGELSVWNVTNGREHSMANALNKVFALSPDGTKVFGASEGDAGVFDAQTGKQLRVLDDTASLTRSAFSPDSQFLAINSFFVGGEARHLRLFEVASGELRDAPHAEPKSRSRWDFEGRQLLKLVWGQRNGYHVQVWQMPDSKPATKLLTPASLSDAAFLAGGRRIVTLGGGYLRIWDTESGEQLLRIPGAGNHVDASSDGRFLMTEAYGGPQKKILKVYHADVSGLTPHLKEAVTPQKVEAPEQKTQNLRAVAARQKELAEVRLHALQLLRAMDERAASLHADARDLLMATNEKHRGFAFGYLKNLMDQGQQKLTGPKGHPIVSTGLALSADGKWLVAGGRTVRQQVSVWKLRSYQRRTPEATREAKQKHTLRVSFHAELPWRSGYLESVAISHDGKLIAAGNHKGEVRIWNTVTGEPQQTFQAHGKDVRAIIFSPKGDRVVTSSDDGTTKVWSTSGDELQQLKHSGKSLAITPDGEWLALGSHDVRIYGLPGGELKHTLRPPGSGPHIVAFDHNGGRLVTAGSSTDVWTAPPKSEDSVHIWNVQTGKRQLTIPMFRRTVRGVEFSADSRRLAMVCNDRKVYVCDAATGRAIETAEGIDRYPNDLAFHPNGSQVIVGAHSDLRIFQLGDPPGPLVLNSSVPGVFSHDSKWVATTDKGRVEITRLETEDLVKSLDAHKGSVLAVAFSADSRRLATSGSDKTVKIWNTNSWQQETSLSVELPASRLSFSPDGSLLLSSDGPIEARPREKPERLIVWELATGKQLFSVKDVPRRLHRLEFPFSFSPDSSMLVVRQAGALKILDARTGEERQTLAGKDAHLCGLSFNPTSNNVVGVFNYPWADGDCVVVWDATTGKQVFAHRGKTNGWLSDADWSSDGRLVLKPVRAPSGGEAVGVWDARTGQTVSYLRGHRSTIADAEFLANGKQVASVGREGKLRIWDTSTGQELLSLPHDSVTHIDTSPDGRFIMTRSRSSLKIWKSSSVATRGD